MQLCEYGCGKKATHQFKNGKWCCEKDWRRCPEKLKESRMLKTGKSHPMYGIKKSKETREKISKANKGNPGPNKGKKFSKKTREKLRNAMKGRIPWNKGLNYKFSKEGKKRVKDAKRLTISKIKNRYPFFFKIEEIQYNPDKPGEKEIQVHCKNHNCLNSKEKGGWFTPTGIQLYERIRHLEKEYGNGGCYFYCSEECKNECPLYNLVYDPFKNKDLLYTESELNTWKEQVKTLDNSKCQICETRKNIHVHHIIPKKLEPFFSLDPENGICLCKKCHYKYAHKNECSTGKLASKVC